MKMKIKLFTHVDADGLGCHILAYKAFENVDVSYCTYTDINQEVLSFLKQNDLNTYDKIFITDISVNQEAARLINQSIGYKTQLLDHHGTASYLNEYTWAYVAEKDENNMPVCGTLLFYRYLIKNRLLSLSNTYLLEMVAAITQWDTWEWIKHPEEKLPQQIGRLANLKDKRSFVNDFVMRSYKKKTFQLSEKDLNLLEYDEQNKNQYIDTVKKSVIFKNFKGKSNKNYVGAVVFAEQYISDLSEKILEEYSEAQFVAIINLKYKNMSFRSKTNDIDLAEEIASLYGGGGHPKSCGAPLSESVYDELINVCILR